MWFASLGGAVRSIGSMSARLVSKRVSTVGMKRFGEELAGAIAVQVIIDEAAEHSQWVEENRDILMLALGLTIPAHSGAIKRYVASSMNKSKGLLFSKVRMTNSLQSISRLASKMRVSVQAESISIHDDIGRLILSLRVEGANVVFSHLGSFAAAAILAAGFGGHWPTRTEDLEDFGHMLVLQIADLELDRVTWELRKLLRSHDALNLLEVGPLLVRSFLEEHPEYSVESAVAELSLAHAEVAQPKSGITIKVVKDADGDEVFLLGDGVLALKEFGEVQVLVPSTLTAETNDSVSESSIDVMMALNLFLNNFREGGYLPMFKAEDSDIYLSEAEKYGNVAVLCFFDVKSMRMCFAIARDSFLDSAGDDLEEFHSEYDSKEMMKLLAGVDSYFGHISSGDVVYSTGNSASPASAKNSTLMLPYELFHNAFHSAGDLSEGPSHLGK